MSAARWLVAVIAVAAVWLAHPGTRARPADAASEPGAAPRDRAADGDLLHRWRPAWSGGAALAGWAWLPGWAGLVAGVVGAVVVWVVIGRAEPATARRVRAAARAELPHLVALLGATVRAGSAPQTGIEVVCAAFPGPAADRLRTVRARLTVGVDPGVVWRDLAADPVLAPLGRSLARAHATGSSVADSVAALAAELARSNRARAEDRARAVGVKAALPLGLCLLPGFLLVGIVPVAAGLLATLTGS